jgi:O-antigen/teichoic acid export membrane protein
MVGAALLALGHKTRWVASILGCYVFLVSVFGNLPLIFDPGLGGSAIAGLLINLAVLGGVLYWLHGERLPSAPWVKTALPMAHSATAWPARLLACQDPSGPQTPAPGQVTGHAAPLPCR